MSKQFLGARLSVALGAIAAAAALSLNAGAVEFKEYSNEKYGFSLKIPAPFELQGEDRTVSWSYQPGSPPSAAPSAPATSGEAKPKGKLGGIGGKLKEIGKGAVASQAPAAPSTDAGSGGGLQPAVGIYVNWTWMPDVDAGTLYKANLDSVKQDIASPDPKYKDPVAFDKKKGYSYDGNTFWYKEIDKKDGEEIHRWHIYSAGNKSAYTIGLTGTYAQFAEWGPVYEEVIKSFKLIPMKKE